VTFDETRIPPAIREMNLIPLQTHPDLGLGWVRTRVEADGSFTTPGLLPGRYIVFPKSDLRRPDRPFEPLWAPSSILIDGRAVGTGWIDLGGSDIDVEIALTDRRAVITGTVRDSRGD
jgi:hypothetical protein